MRGAESWGESPLVGPATLLTPPGEAGVSDAVRELAGVATSEKTEGPGADWVPLLETELARTRQIQDELPALRAGREVEQAVVAVFLHSQPIGHKASTPDLARLSGAAGPDAIEEPAPQNAVADVRWAQVSESRSQCTRFLLCCPGNRRKIADLV